jgi:hypothetical protein
MNSCLREFVVTFRPKAARNTEDFHVENPESE